MLTNLLRRFLKDESGQGITEYGAILAFVAVLVALVFSATSGGLRVALSNAFSLVVSTLDTLATSAS